MRNRIDSFYGKGSFKRKPNSNWKIALFFCCFFGMIGVHHFYMKRPFMGIGVFAMTAVGVFLFLVGYPFSILGLLFLLASAIWNILDFLFILFSALEAPS